MLQGDLPCFTEREKPPKLSQTQLFWQKDLWNYSCKKHILFPKQPQHFGKGGGESVCLWYGFEGDILRPMKKYPRWYSQYKLDCLHIHFKLNAGVAAKLGSKATQSQGLQINPQTNQKTTNPAKSSKSTYQSDFNPVIRYTVKGCKLF